MTNDLKNVDVLILCGGKGERLKSIVSDRPKVMADIHGKPLLQRIIERLADCGFRRFILSVGYLKNYIIDHFKTRPLSGRDNLTIGFSEEDFPLGTGGAVKRAKDLIQSDPFLAMNGDSLLQAPFADFYAAHLEHQPIVSLLISKMSDARDYGRIELDPSGRISGFREKDEKGGEGLVSAGVYLMRRDIFNHMPSKDDFSLEYDLFPNVLNHYCHGFITDEEFLDIGTPERYLRAQRVIRSMGQ